LKESLDPGQKCINVLGMHHFIFGNAADLAAGKRNMVWGLLMEHQSQKIPAECVALSSSMMSQFLRFWYIPGV